MIALEAGDEDWVFAIEWELCYLDQALKDTEQDCYLNQLLGDTEEDTE